MRVMASNPLLCFRERNAPSRGLAIYGDIEEARVEMTDFGPSFPAIAASSFINDLKMALLMEEKQGRHRRENNWGVKNSVSNSIAMINVEKKKKRNLMWMRGKEKSIGIDQNLVMCV